MKAPPEPAPASPLSAPTPGRILVIDDTPANIRLLIDLLKADYEIIFATGGERGLELAGADPAPDLILLDLMMPGMDGYEVCRRLKDNDRTRNIPVMFVTGADSEAAEAQGINVGAVDYLTRPISSPILRARVRTHVNARRQNLMYEQLASVDGLTGLANRRRFDQALAQEWERARRTREPLALLFADVDHFKRYNDTYGHGAGDDVLRQVARQLLFASRRPADLAARYGGEEVVLLMPDTDLDGVVAVAEDLRESVAQLRIGSGYLTISVGCSSRVPIGDQSAMVLLEQADAELYRAKRGGRNRVCYEGSPEIPAAPEPSR